MATILVVDDRAVNREFLAMLLGYAGHRVVDAADGSAALELARQLRPDLVISDIVMPTMGGVEFARLLRADAEIAHIPIIFYTASYRLGDAHSLARSYGVSAVLSKPSKPQLILDTVAAALGLPVAPAPKRPVLVGAAAVAEPDLTLSLRLSLLIELGLELSAQRDPQHLLDLACRAGQEIFGADYAAVGIVDAPAGRLSRFATRGLADEAVAGFAALDTRCGLLAAVLDEGRPRRLPTPAEPATASGLPAGHPAIGALLVAPLSSATRAYGWLYVANRVGGEVFGEADEQIALTLAAKLALAYENLFLYDTLQHYAARLEADSADIKRLNAGLEQQVQARQISETRFRLAMEVETTLAYTLDRELRYTWAHSCQAGFDQQALLGKSEFELCSDESARRLTALYRQVIDTGRGLRQDVRVCSVDQPLAPRDIELVVEPMKEADGTLAGIICAAVDITERKRVEAELRASRAEAERANSAKSRFLAAASHDLRQPLAALTVYMTVLKDKVAPADRRILTNMNACIEGLSGLLGDLLDLSKLEAGVVTPNPSDFLLADLLADLESVHTPEAELKGLRLRCRPCRVTAHTDPVLFRRILGNFVANGICHSERGGVLVGCRRRLGKTWVEVWDTGVGIAADQITAIFEEFKQLGDDARNRGSGLGLSIVAKTASLLGLEIRVHSRPGRGSLFAVELPLGKSAPSPAPPPGETVYRPLRVALVEDNPLVREALNQALQGIGHQVVAAATGDRLLTELGSLPPDIVISDYRLADGETGFDVITAVRAAISANLPALLITGDTDPTLMRSMIERGVVVLHKPVDMDTLQAYLEDLTYQSKP